LDSIALYWAKKPWDNLPTFYETSSFGVTGNKHGAHVMAVFAIISAVGACWGTNVPVGCG